MSATKWFDTEAELQKLRSAPAKVAKLAKADEEDTENFSHFSHFSWGEGTKTQISVPHSFLESESDAWPCGRCGRPATIVDVFPALDRERTLTFWSCEPCQVVAVTPDAIREPPTGWVTRAEQ